MTSRSAIFPVPPALTLAGLCFLILALCLPAQALARSDRYRVELLLFQRTTQGPVQENISHASSDWLPAYGVPLWVDSDWQGNVQDAPEEALGSDRAGVTQRPEIRRLGTDNLRLSPVRDSLRRSGNYEVLSFTAWEDDFPHDYKTAPLAVDLITRFDGERAIRGYIEIERRRFLHVNVQLFDLRPAEKIVSLDGHEPQSTRTEGDNALVVEPMEQLEEAAPAWQTTTWLREMRRMRSEEVHYLDSPSIGVLVYFHPLPKE
ncbi:MAG: hypothetical protein EA349_06885 [Halomonadaceae bacterium]|nr:MAG: hypothetical protein EA349_06885 [Halomonadaceae bacterium]